MSKKRMTTKIRKFVVYGKPWFTSTLKDAVEINVLEPDIAVNNHIPLELLAVKWPTLDELFERVVEEAKQAK